MVKRVRHQDAKASGSLLCGGVLATRLTTENLQKCHDQAQSRLFSCLPPEIRNEIFQLATSSYDDPDNRYQSNDYCYRPGYHAKQLTSLSLLLTCRRIWLETNGWPTFQASPPTFWFKDENRRPNWARSQRTVKRRRRAVVVPELPEEKRMTQYFSKLTETTIANFKMVRIFAQMYWLEDSFWRAATFGGSRSTFSPSVLTVTVRHTDWWNWEAEAALGMKMEWLDSFLSVWNANHPFMPQTEFRLELETLDYKVGQLSNIIQQIQRHWAHQRHDTLWKLQEDSGKQTSAWSGPTDIGGITFQQYAHLTKLDYRVFTLVWHKRLTNPDITVEHQVGKRVRRKRGAGSLVNGGQDAFLAAYDQAV